VATAVLQAVSSVTCLQEQCVASDGVSLMTVCTPAVLAPSPQQHVSLMTVCTPAMLAPSPQQHVSLMTVCTPAVLAPSPQQHACSVTSSCRQAGSDSRMQNQQGQQWCSLSVMQAIDIFSHVCGCWRQVRAGCVVLITLCHVLDAGRSAAGCSCWCRRRGQCGSGDVDALWHWEAAAVW
jgi:hypothetical protein